MQLFLIFIIALFSSIKAPRAQRLALHAHHAQDRLQRTRQHGRNHGLREIIFPDDEIEVLYQNNFGRCITPEGERSACVYLQECNDLYALLTKVPLTDNDKLYLKQSQCGYYQGKVLVCCPPRSSRPPARASTPTPAAPVTYAPVVDNGIGTLPQPGVCGAGTTDRIYGGNITRIDEYPWMALLEYTKPGNRKGHHCGGSLINERYVITASHCVNGKAIPSDWRLTGVRLGEWDTSTTNDCDEDDCAPPHQDISIEQAIPHEQYDPNSRTQNNDIALLRLARRVEYSDFIKPVCLPQANHLRSASFEGVPMDVAGWGKTESTSSSNVKLKARVNGVSLQQCNDVYKLQNVNLGNNQICAGGEKGIDSCRGDSGGPLIGYDNNKQRPYYFLVGVVSFGPTPCGLEGWPGVYTRTGAYVDWIQSHIRA